VPTLPALHASGSAAALRIRDHLRGLRWGVPYPLRNGILPLLRIGFRDCEAKMNGGYRRAIPYAADDTPDRLWAGSGEVRWLVRDGKPVNRQGQALLQGPLERRETRQGSIGEAGPHIGHLPLSHRALSAVCSRGRVCIQCDTHFQSNSSKAAKWCPDCRAKRAKQQRIDWVKQHRAAQPKPPKTCPRCGSSHTSSSRLNLCQACQVIHHREQARKRAAERREEAKGEI